VEEILVTAIAGKGLGKLIGNKPAGFRCEELRVICGTRGFPGTVAPFRAWRGSRDLVAQSPKLHAPAVA